MSAAVNKQPRLLIAGVHSGVGKSSINSGIGSHFT